MVFVPKDWQNSPSNTTPITAEELDRMEAGIVEGTQDASETQKGNVELATAAELNTGTDLTRVPSVKRIADYVTTAVAAGGGAIDASETAKGIVELATAAELNTGTDLTRVPSVKRVADYVTSAVDSVAVSAGSINEPELYPPFLRTIEAVLRWDGSGTQPLRSTVTADSLRPVRWRQPTSPPTTTGYAVAGLDVWEQT